LLRKLKETQIFILGSTISAVLLALQHNLHMEFINIQAKYFIWKVCVIHRIHTWAHSCRLLREFLSLCSSPQ